MKKTKNEIKNYCKNCEAWCCYDGVYLTDEDIDNINFAIKLDNEFFNFLPEKYITVGSWKDISGKKTEVKEKHYLNENYPKHFNQTTCVFLINNKCMLEEFARIRGEDPWKYKPKTCSIFPLQKCANGKGYNLPNLVGDNLIFDDYDGFISKLPCFNCSKSKFKKEFKFIKNT